MKREGRDEAQGPPAIGQEGEPAKWTRKSSQSQEEPGDVSLGLWAAAPLCPRASVDSFCNRPPLLPRAGPLPMSVISRRTFVPLQRGLGCPGFHALCPGCTPRVRSWVTSPGSCPGCARAATQCPHLKLGTERPAQRASSWAEPLCLSPALSSTRTCQRRCEWRPWSCASRPVRNSPTTTRYCHRYRAAPVPLVTPVGESSGPGACGQLQRVLPGPG